MSLFYTRNVRARNDCSRRPVSEMSVPEMSDPDILPSSDPKLCGCVRPINARAVGRSASAPMTMSYIAAAIKDGLRADVYEIMFGITQCADLILTGNNRNIRHGQNI